MSRPVKLRKVCSLPDNKKYGPIDLTVDEENYINMTIDEYETIRLIDLEDFTQEECAKQMNIARTTVQGIYKVARRKMAESLVDGKLLIIDGGEIRICNNLGNECGPGCQKERQRQRNKQRLGKGQGHGRRFKGHENRDE